MMPKRCEPLPITWKGETPIGGPSQEEKNLQAEQAAETQQYMQQQSTQFAENQDLFNTLKPLLEQQITNPTGFNAEELASLNASNVNTTGAQYANVQKQLNLANASQNMAGLTSGVQAAETAGLQSAAAGTVASNANNINLASAQLAQQKSANAQSQLEALESGAGGMAVSLGQVENQSQSQAFNQAYQMQQQSSQLLNSVIGGLVSTGMDFATGGLSSVAQGNSFLEGGMSAIGGG